MRLSVFIVLQVLVVTVLAGIFYSHTEHVIALKRPPASIAQWYKPANKRQVWLHTMFKLRRQMLAIEIYAKAQDAENLNKWTSSLGKEYRKISEMVPEWEKRINLDAMAELEAAAAEKRFGDVAGAVGELGQTCKSCHKDFRAVTATLYRAPDFTAMKVGDYTEFKAHMGALSEQVNRIKIGFVDGRDEAALEAFAGLSKGMQALGGTCITCHAKSPKPYPDAAMSKALVALRESLDGGQLKDKGRALGTLAVLACARCHATHRLSYDAQQLFGMRKSVGDMLDHSY